MNNKNTTTKLPKDVSRFTRWVNGLDETDKTLKPLTRKGKWTVIIIVLFVMFGLSFLWFPAVKINPEDIASPIAKQEESNHNQSVQSAFELPVDSFENHLKTLINEDISEKE